MHLLVLLYGSGRQICFRLILNKAVLHCYESIIYYKASLQTAPLNVNSLGAFQMRMADYKESSVDMKGLNNYPIEKNPHLQRG